MTPTTPTLTHALAEAANAIDRAQVVAEALPRWIPVSERLPEEKDADVCGCVLGWNPESKWVQRDHWRAFHGSHPLHSHWMPLPAPPQPAGAASDAPAATIPVEVFGSMAGLDGPAVGIVAPERLTARQIVPESETVKHLKAGFECGAAGSPEWELEGLGIPFDHLGLRYFAIDAAELVMALQNPQQVHAAILRGTIKLTREQALHIAGCSAISHEDRRKAIEALRAAQTDPLSDSTTWERTRKLVEEALKALGEL